MSAIPQSLRDDLLTGAVDIAAFLGPRWTKRKIYYAAERGTLPISRVGETLVARKSELNRALSALPQSEEEAA